MHWILWILTYIVAFFIGIYILGTVILALFAKFEKDEKGNLKLDAQSWHFKLAFPVARYERGFWDTLKRFSPNTCGYRRKFSHGLFIIWPALIVMATFAYIVLTPFAFLLGHYPRHSIEHLAAGAYKDDELPGFMFRRIKWVVFRGRTIYPLWAIALVLMVWNFSPIVGAMTSNVALGLYAFMGKALLWIALVVACVVAIVAIIVGIVLAAHKISGANKEKEEGEQVSAVWVFTKSAYDKVCYPIKIYNVPNSSKESA
jgi:hypothetical protein